MRRSELKVRHIRMDLPDPDPVLRMVAHKDEKKVAILRGSGSIELWAVDASSGFPPRMCRVARVSCRAEEAPRSLCWAREEPVLLVGGLDGWVSVADWGSGVLRRVGESHGGAVWSLASREGVVAAGCEDGSVRLMEWSEDGGELLYYGMCVGREGRVVSVSFHPETWALFSGSAKGAIRGWDVRGRRSRNAFVAQLTGASAGGEIPVVWSVVCSRGWTLLCGRSDGMVTVLNGRSGGREGNIRAHGADVLEVGFVNDDVAVSCGADGAVCRLVGGGRWDRAVRHTVHSHDVHSVVVVQGHVVSGGVDCDIRVAPIDDFEKVTTIPWTPSTAMTSHDSVEGGVCVAMKNRATLVSGDGSFVELRSPADRHYTACAISPGAEWTALGTGGEAVLLRMKDGEVSSRKLELPYVHRFVFASPCILFAATSQGAVLIQLPDLDISSVSWPSPFHTTSKLSDPAPAKKRPRAEHRSQPPNILHAQATMLSSTQAVLTCTLDDTTIGFTSFDLSKSSPPTSGICLSATSPISALTTTTLSMLPHSPLLALTAHIDGTLSAASVLDNGAQCTTTVLNPYVGPAPSSLSVMHPARDGVLVFLASPDAIRSTYLAPKLDETPEKSTTITFTVTASPTQKRDIPRLVSAQAVDTHTLVVAEVPSVRFVRSLPPPVDRKRFGD